MDRSRTEEADLIRLAFTKDRRQSNRLDYLAERQVFEMLEDEGIVAVRSQEGAPIDGAFLRVTATESQHLRHSNQLTRLQWAVSTNADITPFDIKHATTGLLPKGNSSALLYIIVVLGVHDAVAIIPRQDYKELVSCTKNNPFHELKSALWRYMCHKSVLRHLVERTSAGRYSNLSTGIDVELDMKHAGSPLLANQNTRAGSVASNAAVSLLWDRIQAALEEGSMAGRIELDTNCVQPLIGDWVIRLPKKNISLAVEHKYSKRPPEFGATHTSRDRLSAKLLDPSRVWDLAIIQESSTGNTELALWCVPNYALIGHITNDGNLALPENLATSLRFNGMDSITRMLSFIEGVADQICDARQRVVASLASLRMEPNERTMFACAQRLLQGPAPPVNEPEIEWFYLRLRKQCRDDGRCVLLPLDPGEVTGDYVFIDHQWTPEEQVAFDKKNKDPFETYSPGVMKRPLICLRLWDLTFSPSGPTTQFRRTEMSFKPKAPNIEFLVIGATEASRVGSAEQCLLMPSEYVKIPVLPTEDFDRVPLASSHERNFNVEVSFEQRVFDCHHLTVSEYHPSDFAVRIAGVCQIVSTIFGHDVPQPLDVAELSLQQQGVLIQPQRYISTLAHLAKIGMAYGRFRKRSTMQPRIKQKIKISVIDK